jgi:Fe2+ transport system protein B
MLLSLAHTPSHGRIARPHRSRVQANRPDFRGPRRCTQPEIACSTDHIFDIFETSLFFFFVLDFHPCISTLTALYRIFLTRQYLLSYLLGGSIVLIYCTIHNLSSRLDSGHLVSACVRPLPADAGAWFNFQSRA